MTIDFDGMKTLVTFVFLFGIFTSNMAQRIPKEPPYEEVSEDALSVLTQGRERDSDFERFTTKHVYILEDGRALLDGMLYGKIYASKEVLHTYLAKVHAGLVPTISTDSIPVPYFDTVSTEEGMNMIDGQPMADRDLFEQFGCLAIEISGERLLVGTDGDFFELYDKAEYIAYRERLKVWQENSRRSAPTLRPPGLWYDEDFPKQLDTLAKDFLNEIGLPDFAFHFSSFSQLDSAVGVFQREYWLETKDFLGLSAIVHLIYLAEFEKSTIQMRKPNPSGRNKKPGMEGVPEPVIIDQDGNEFNFTKYFWVALNTFYNEDREPGANFAAWMPRSKAGYEEKLRDWKHPK